MTERGTSLRFQDKVAIVTGGCKGIGRGCVDIFVENGGKVAVLDIDDDTGTKMKTDGPGEIFYVHCDTSKEEEIKTAVETTVSKFGKVDCLVNNAGWHPPMGTIEDFSADDFRQLLDLNLVGYFLMCKYVLPYLRETKGCVVNISSAAGMLGQGNAITYTATKGGIIAMAKAMAVDEAKNGVRVNVISPGAILTPLMEKFLNPEKDRDAELELFGRYSLMHRLGDAREIGRACLFLASEATYTTGENLSCSGGMEIGYGQK